jgi:hypothetical protein
VQWYRGMESLECLTLLQACQWIERVKVCRDLFWTHLANEHHTKVNSTPSQTKVLEGRTVSRTNLSECVSREALFKGVSTLFGLLIAEKFFPGNALGKIGSAFQNLRLWSTNSACSSQNIMSVHLLLSSMARHDVSVKITRWWCACRTYRWWLHSMLTTGW